MHVGLVNGGSKDEHGNTSEKASGDHGAGECGAGARAGCGGGGSQNHQRSEAGEPSAVEESTWVCEGGEVTANEVRVLLALIESAERVCFIAETVAHLQGRERLILPTTDQARAGIEAAKALLVERRSNES